MPPLKKPPTGASSKAYSVHQPNIFSREVELSRNTRGSLEIFGGGPQTSPLLFSRTRSAWKDALQCAESHLQEQDTGKVVASVSGTSLPSSQRQLTTASGDHPSVVSSAALYPRCCVEDDVSKWLTDAEVPGDTSKLPSSVSRSLEYGSDTRDITDLNLEASRKRLSGYPVEPAKTTVEQKWDEVLKHRRGKKISGLSEISDEALSERAAQWGYGVVLKPSNNRGSGSAETEGISRLSWTTGSSDTSSGLGKSSRTTSEGSSACSSFSPMIPGLSKNVKEALASFQLAFVVCDALNAEYPILYASAGFFSMTGYTAKEVVGRNCRFLQGQYTDAHDIAMIRGALREGNIYTGKLLNYKKDGSPFWNLLTISPIRDDGGRLIKYIGMQAEVTESAAIGNSLDQNGVPAGVKNLIEAEGRKEIKDIPAIGGVTSATRVHRKSSDESDCQRTSRSRYSLSNSRQSFELSSNVTVALDFHTASNMRTEVAALRAGAVDSGGLLEVPKGLRGESSCMIDTKNTKRTSSLLKMFKKLNGRFSRRGSRDCSYEDPIAVEDHNGVVSDPDEEDVDDFEGKQRRSSFYSSAESPTGIQDLDETCELPRVRKNNSQSRHCSEERRECTGRMDRESPLRKERFSGDYSRPGSSEHGIGRTVVGYGRRSAEYPGGVVNAFLKNEGLASGTSNRRHSLATIPSVTRASFSVDGKSQFCIVHPTAPDG
ncbi:hypothetical protein Mapa_013828 [Marchantia paleacea]|uniref:Putative LOV domain-containing protein n=1 Tax=Marchantia paleacea TaxID=56867 RepID=A0A126WXK1_MARPA|nr:putative LOV domain-containing protein [Marchantia paleacea]KAG6544730.1 hypothetical protein Mapa_013828 [Marchantia paleacea]